MKKNDASIFRKLEDFSPEELEEMERKDVELEAQYRTEDMAMINGRCVSCEEKCKWYHETMRELKI
jgi:hypothetical protein